MRKSILGLSTMMATLGLMAAVGTAQAQVFFDYTGLTTIDSGATTGGSTLIAGDPNPATGTNANALAPGTDIRAGFFHVTSTTTVGSDHISAVFSNDLTITDVESGLSHVFMSHGTVMVDVNTSQSNNTVVAITDLPQSFQIGAHLYEVTFVRFDSIGNPSADAASYSYHVNAVDTAVPEPGSIAMLAGLGVTGTAFAFSRLRRRK